MVLTRFELAALLAGAVLCAEGVPAAESPSTAAGGKTAMIARTDPARAASQHYLPDRFAGRAGLYYRLVWGVEDLSVRSAESGEVIRFSYRVLDPGKAKSLNDDHNEPVLIDPRAGVQLSVPRMDKIGQLRQIATPEAGKAYWMVFSNKGRPVRHGDHVIVQIGQFRANGLVVD